MRLTKIEDLDSRAPAFDRETSQLRARIHKNVLDLSARTYEPNCNFVSPSSTVYYVSLLLLTTPESVE